MRLRGKQVSMARCSCGGSTCSCVLEDGTGTTVEGSGSSAAPYRVNVSGGIAEGSIVAVSTDTLQLATSGAGTLVDPLQITGRVTMDMLDLLDVNDPAGAPAEGEVPVWTTDHWEFKVPAAAPPGAVNVGAGIKGDGSSGLPLLAAISGTWGSGDMAGFPADQTLGTPTYVDTLGQIRARPTPVVQHHEDPIQVYAAGWAGYSGGALYEWLQWGPFVYVVLDFVRTGATISMGGQGNPSNLTVADVNGIRAAMPTPLSYAALGTGMVGHMIGSFLTPNRAVQVGNGAPNINIATGSRFVVSGIYIGNTGVVL